MGKGGRYLQSKPRKKNRAGKILLTVILVLVLLAAAGTAAGVLYYNSMLNLISRPDVTENSLSDEEFEQILGYVPTKIDPENPDPVVETTAPRPEPKASDPILNIMIIGQQYREHEESKLSDTLILVSINKETKTITLTSFMRDLYVQLPDFRGHVCGKQRINVAYNLGWHWAGEQGGMEMLDQLILNNFGVDVDYNVEIGFVTFIKIIDVIGGVDMDLTADEARYMSADKETDGTFTEGVNHLDGDAALSYARIRSSNAGDNDFNRTNRQRKLIINILNKLKTMSLTDLNDMMHAVLPLIITDMDNSEITKCAVELLPMLPYLTIESNQCPAEGTYWFDMLYISGVESSVIICDLDANGKLLRAIAEGEP